MDLKVLRYFVATVETGSISAASISCHVAQPSITLAISKLEDELNCKLFDRHRKGSSPTSEGLKMYSMAKDLLSHATSIKNEFIHAKVTEPLKLFVDQNIRVSVLENFIRELHSNTKSINLSLNHLPSYSSNHSSKHDQEVFDMHLTTQSQAASLDWFFPLMNESYALLIPKTNRLAFKSDITIDDLQSQPLITRIHCENKALFENTCNKLGLTFNSVAAVETEEWAHAMVRSGLGLCFAPVPANFKDEFFEIKFVNELFGIALPERLVGLCVKPTKHERIKLLLPYLLES